MIKKIIGGKSVVMYSDIDELPIMRYHKFNKYLMIDAGIGENMSDVDRHLSAMIQMAERNDKVSLQNQINNMRQSLQFVIENVSPKSLAFAVMVKSIDGKECNDLTEFGLNKLITSLAGHGLTWGIIKNTVDFIKKKSKRTLKGISRQ